MPSVRQYIKPLTKLSKEQWKALLARIVEKGKAPLGKKFPPYSEQLATEGKLNLSGADYLLKHFEPPIQKNLGTLAKDIPLGSGEVRRTFERLPIEEARARYLANPGEYVSPSSSGGTSIKEILQGLPPGSPEELAAGIGYKRVNLQPILTPGMRQAQGVMSKIVRGEDIRRKLGTLGVSLKDIAPGVKPEQFLAEKGLSTKSPPIDELIQLAAKAEDIWKSNMGVGGGRSVGAHLWERFRQSQVGGIQQAYKNGKEYFLASYLKWSRDPSKYAKSHPREARLLEQYEKVYTPKGGIE